ncbi:hypothetical protein ACPPVS_08400 [Cellulomonas sp. McL0617]|uniref:hypothetical protein n=1 Tax=Cellulomonas sp. McL0617 TaxID=3415675 RepID=UPI003CF5A3F1
MRVLFATEPGDEDEVRQRIETALSAQRLEAPDGHMVSWKVHATGRGTVAPGEADHGRRLALS